MDEAREQTTAEAAGDALVELSAELSTDLPPVPLLAASEAFENPALAPATEPVGEVEPVQASLLAPDPLFVIGSQLEALAREAAGFNERSAAREALLNRAHDEIERLREGDRRALLQPLLREVTSLRNDLLMQSRSLPADFPAEQAAKLLESFAGSVEQTLERFGVESFAPSVGDDLNFREHRRVGTISTADESLHGKVAAVRADGYRDLELERQLAHAEVMVFDLKRAPAAAVEDSATSDPAPNPVLPTNQELFDE